jgi:hypothetical protein
MCFYRKITKLSNRPYDNFYIYKKVLIKNINEVVNELYIFKFKFRA